MGPVIVTADEIADPHNLNLVTRLNGQVVQSTNTSDLVFNVAQIISYYSRFLILRPGDVITTGSPSGVGFWPQSAAVREIGRCDRSRSPEHRRAAQHHCLTGLAPD